MTFGMYSNWRLGNGTTSTPAMYTTFLEFVKEKSLILDIGCGNGFFFIIGVCLSKFKNYEIIKKK